MHVHMHECMHAHTHTHACTHTHNIVFLAHAHTHTHTHTHTHMHTLCAHVQTHGGTQKECNLGQKVRRQNLKSVVVLLVEVSQFRRHERTKCA